MKRAAIIRITGVEKVYDMGEVQVRALRGVNLEILEGDYVAIMGPSGSGKSTLLNLLGCLDRPTAGSYHLGVEDVSQMDDDELSEVRGRRIGFIFQSYNLIHQLSVIENIQMPLFYQGLDTPKNNLRCQQFAGVDTTLDEVVPHRDPGRTARECVGDLLDVCQQIVATRLIQQEQTVANAVAARQDDGAAS
jgi:ABC-type lipoprotein export system ATPase subunit